MSLEAASKSLMERPLLAQNGPSIGRRYPL